jgi:hypothetical protein
MGLSAKPGEQVDVDSFLEIAWRYSGGKLHLWMEVQASACSKLAIIDHLSRVVFVLFVFGRARGQRCAISV